MITYKKKNQKANIETVIETLKKRIYVENAIGLIKKNERIMTRKDHKIISYMGFVHLGCIINNLKILKKLNHKL